MYYMWVRYLLWGCLLVAELSLLHQCSYFLPPLKMQKFDTYISKCILEYCKMLSLAVFSDNVGLITFKTAIWFTSSCCTILLGPPRRGLLHMVPSVTYRFIYFHTVKNARKGKMDNVFKWITSTSKRPPTFLLVFFNVPEQKIQPFHDRKKLLFVRTMPFV